MRVVCHSIEPIYYISNPKSLSASHTPTTQSTASMDTTGSPLAAAGAAAALTPSRRAFPAHTCSLIFLPICARLFWYSAIPYRVEFHVGVLCKNYGVEARR